MAIHPLGPAVRLPALRPPAPIAPTLPTVQIDRRNERPPAGMPQPVQPALNDPSPPYPRPGAIIDTWAAPGSLPATAYGLPPLAALRGPAAAAPATPGSAPVELALDLPSPATLDDPAGALADALKRAVESSGVFYESHLADWVEGRRTLAEVADEARPAADPAAPPRHTAEAEPQRAQQIDFLRQGEIGWTLPAPWQGTALWVGEAPPGPQEAGEASAVIRLDLEIPGRGRLQVSLRLNGEALFVDLASRDGAALLPDEIGDLGHRLQLGGGAPLAALTAAPNVCARGTSEAGGMGAGRNPRAPDNSCTR